MIHIATYERKGVSYNMRNQQATLADFLFPGGVLITDWQSR